MGRVPRAVDGKRRAEGRGQKAHFDGFDKLTAGKLRVATREGGDGKSGNWESGKAGDGRWWAEGGERPPSHDASTFVYQTTADRSARPAVS